MNKSFNQSNLLLIEIRDMYIFLLLQAFIIE